MIMENSALRFEEKILEIVYKSSKRIFWPVLVHNGFIALLIHHYIDVRLCAAWLIWMTFLIVVRIQLIDKIYHNQSLTLEKKLKFIQVLVLIAGLSHALTVLFIPSLPPYHQATVSMILAGLCTGCLFTNAGYRPLLYAYVFPILFTLAFVWAFVIEHSIGPSNVITGLVVIAYLLLLINFAKDIRATLFESYKIRLEYMKLNERLESALQNEERSNQAKTRFLASASHDLRQPLNTLSLYSAALSFQKLDEKSHTIAKNMKTTIDVLSSQLDSLLDISKLDAGIIDIKLGALNLNELLIRLQQEYLYYANEKNIDLIIKAQEPIVVSTDSVQFERILRNLISNAIKYTDKGFVAITATKDTTNCCICVSDTGLGIPENQQKKVFEEFYQIDNESRDRTKGLGLGLSIVKRLCHLLNIEILLKSNQHEGTSVSLTLSINETIEFVGDDIVEQQQDLSIFKDCELLIIDDDQCVQEAMKTLLTRLGSHVRVASCTQDALALVSEKKPDIALVDYRLKNTDNGVKTILALREFYPLLPAIVVTGDIAQDKLIDIKDNDIPMIHKPIKLDELAKMMGLLI